MIYITGDTHGEIDINKLSSRNFPIQKQLTKNDFVIICGDFGFIWANDNTQKYWLKWFQNKKFHTLFIDGNHENFDLLNKYKIEEWNGGKIHRINDSIFHLLRGNVYNICGLRIFTFGGGESVDKQYRIENITWWKEEMPNEEEYKNGLSNLKKHGNKVDLIVTHTAPSSILKIIDIDNYSNFNDLSEFLDTIKNTVKYEKWFIGHYHLDKYYEKDKILLINKEIEKIDLTIASTG